jgi:hypothetical protein
MVGMTRRLAAAVVALAALVAATSPATPIANAQSGVQQGGQQGGQSGEQSGEQPPGGQPSAGTTALPLPRPTEPRDLQLVDQTTFAAPGSPVALAFRIRGSEPSARLDLTVHRAASSRIQFGETLRGVSLGPSVQSFDNLDPSSLPTDPDGTIQLNFTVVDDTIPAALGTIVLPDPGVYPLSITLRVPGQDDQVLVTHLVRLATDNESGTPVTDDGSPTFSVGLLVAMRSPTVIDDRGQATITDEAAAALRDTARALAGRDQPATLLTQPATLDALAQRPDGRDTVEAIATAAGRGQVLGSTWVPVDAGSLLARGLGDYLGDELDAGTGTIARLLGASAGPAPTTWMIDAGVDPAALQFLVDRGISRVVVPETLADPIDTRRFPVTLTQPFVLVPEASGPGTRTPVPAVPALQTDTITSLLLRSSAQPALAANRALADLALLAFDLPDVRRGAVVEVPGDAPVAGALDRVLAGLGEAAAPPAGARPLLEAATIEAIFRTTPPTGTSAGTTAERNGALQRSWNWADPSDLGDFPARLAATDYLVAAMASTVRVDGPAPEAEATLATVDGAVLAAGTAGFDDAARSRQLDLADDLARAALAPIGVPAQGTVTLTSDEGVVPVVIENGRADPVRVVLELVSDKLDFPGGNEVELELAPGSNRIEAAVQTRASGVFPIEVSVRTPEGALSIASGRFTVRSTAVSGLGVGLSLVAGIFLAAWWARNLRSAHRRRQLVRPEAGS